MATIKGLFRDIERQQRIYNWLFRFSTEMVETFGPCSLWGDLTLARMGSEDALVRLARKLPWEPDKRNVAAHDQLRFRKDELGSWEEARQEALRVGLFEALHYADWPQAMRVRAIWQKTSDGQKAVRRPQHELARPPQKLDIPEWGGLVWVRGLNAAECERLARMFVTGDDERPSRLTLESIIVVSCLVDEQGRRIFADDDVEWVGSRSCRAIDRIVRTAQAVASAAIDGPLKVWFWWLRKETVNAMEAHLCGEPYPNAATMRATIPLGEFDEASDDGSVDGEERLLQEEGWIEAIRQFDSIREQVTPRQRQFLDTLLRQDDIDMAAASRSLGVSPATGRSMLLGIRRRAASSGLSMCS